MKDEPVVCIVCKSNHKCWDSKCQKIFTPQTKEWQYLTEDEIKEIVGGYSSEGGIGAYTRTLIDKIEAKIKEKNDIFSS